LLPICSQKFPFSPFFIHLNDRHHNLAAFVYLSYHLVTEPRLANGFFSSHEHLARGFGRAWADAHAAIFPAIHSWHFLPLHARGHTTPLFMPPIARIIGARRKVPAPLPAPSVIGLFGLRGGSPSKSGQLGNRCGLRIDQLPVLSGCFRRGGAKCR
jgi:hypothetical protein